MSRIIVKNLPNKVTEKQLHDHFSKFGMVTDVNLKYKENGTFRGFGFIGFENDEVAEKTYHHFKDTFFKQNKIFIEMCKDFGYKYKSALQEKLNKKIIKEESQIKKFNDVLEKETRLTKEKLRELIKNPDFIQYITVNQKGTTNLLEKLQKKYGTDDLPEEIPEQSSENADEKGDCDKTKLANQEISDFEYLQSLMKSSFEDPSESQTNKLENFHTIVIRTKEMLTSKEKKGKTLTRKGVKQFLHPLKFRSLRIPSRMSFVAYVGFRTEKEMNQALLKDKGFSDGVRVRVHKYQTMEAGEEEPALENVPWKAAEEKLVTSSVPVAESGKLYVRNLWYSVTEEDLKQLFETIGPLADLTLPVSMLTRKPKGFAHVSYVFPEHAVKALNDLDGTDFKGRIIHILPSLNQEMEPEPTNFKERKKMKERKSASSWHNWNSLFLGSSAVIDLVTQNFRTSKHQLFEDNGGQSAAVSLALGETQIVEETKRFMEAEGVSLDAFTDPNVQRSSTVILVKNLPAKTSAQELRELFCRYGELGRVLLPPSGVTAIIEYLDPGEAKRGYRELAYSKFKYLPLYLEWAPVQVFKTAVTRPPPTIDTSQDYKDADLTENKEDQKKTFDPESKTTLYVKNLNLKTEEETIKQHFSHIGEVYAVLVARRRGLSQGYGFVQFVKASDASKALKQLQNYLLEGHYLELKYSEKKLDSAANMSRKLQTPGEPSSAKILVKNIPFQAEPFEVEQLFATFGELKGVRLPKKPSSSEHRGFGFVEFITAEEAKKAFQSLGASTHLYGRRLVLEWAKQDDSVAELQRKTAEQFWGSGSTNKRRKVEVPAPQDSDD